MQTSQAVLLRGAARPRIEVGPTYAYSLGDIACDFAAKAGLILDPWQRDSLELMMACREDDQWACREFVEMVGRQNGKGAILEARALASFLLLGDELVMWSAHEFKTAIRAFRRVRTLIKRLGKQVGNNENLWDLVLDGQKIRVKVSNTNGEQGFERQDTEAELKFIARSKSSGRGFSGDLVIIDETFAYTDEHHEALMPTMSARTNPQIVYTSSPPLTGHTGERLYLLRKRALSGDPEETAGLGYRDWGLEGDLDHVDQIDLTDPELWAATNPALGIRISEEWIRGERRSFGPVGFARERLGVWPVQIVGGGEVAIPYKAWEGRAGAQGRPRGQVSLALAASWPDAGWCSIGLAAEHEGELWVQLLEHERGDSWVVRRFQQLTNDHSIPDVVVDPQGPAGYLIPELEAVGIKVVKPTARDVVYASAHFLAAVDGDAPRLRHYGQPDLDTAVQEAQRRPLEGGWTYARRNSIDIAPLESVSLAAWQLATQPVVFFGAWR